MPDVTSRKESPIHVRKTLTFSGESTAGSPHNLFTVTGRVYVKDFVAFCTTLLGVTATPSISTGVAGDVDAFIASTLATDIDTNEWWGTATPATGSYNPTSTTTGGYQTSQKDKWLSGDIILTMTGAGGSVDSGEVVFDVWYERITDNGALTAA